MGIVHSILDAIPALPEETELSDTDDDSADEAFNYSQESSDSFESSAYESSDSFETFDLVDSSDIDDESSDVEVKVKVKVNVKVKPKVDNRWKERELQDLGIKLTFTNKNDVDAMAACRIEKWSIDDRNESMEEILSGKDEFFGSDIFEVIGPKFVLKDVVTISVSLIKKVSKRHKVKVKLKTDGTWIKEDAIFKNGKAEFKAKRLQHFVIVGDLVTKKVKISPKGTKVKVDDTSKIEVDIPAGAVESDHDVNFQIIPPDATAMKKYLGGSKPICKSIVGVTECLYGTSKSAALKKPINVKLPFERRQDKVEDTTVVPFQMVGREIQIMDTQANIGVSGDGVCNMQVSAFHGYFAGVVKKDRLSNTKSLVREARLIFGTNYLATILMFREREKMATGFPRIWIEIADKINVDKVVEKRRKEQLIEVRGSRSPDINVFDGYRLRIDIEGKLRGLRGIPKTYYLMTYLDVAEDNHKVFTVEKSDSMDATGRFSFISDKGGKDQVHSIDIDVVVGFQRAYRRDNHDKYEARGPSMF